MPDIQSGFFVVRSILSGNLLLQIFFSGSIIVVKSLNQFVTLKSLVVPEQSGPGKAGETKIQAYG
jgi:hypothetical protein